MARSWWHSLFARSVRPLARRKPVLQVETLEDRVVPAFYLVTGIGDESALNPGNQAGTEADPFQIASLRSAIQQANGNGVEDVITFDPTVFATAQTITLGGTALTFGDAANTTIVGTSAGLTISGNGMNRVFLVNTDADATLDRLTITGGSQADGAGIRNSGTLFVSNCLITGNHATNNGGGVIVAAGDATFVNTTISGNTAAFFGGGLTTSGGVTTILSCTFTNNRGNNNNGSASTFGGGGIAPGGGQVLLASSIVAGNFQGSTGTAADNIKGAITSAAFNVIGLGNAGGVVDGMDGNQVAVADPGIGVLANNGGPTRTHALASTSPAKDAGFNAQVPADITSDQRGAPFVRIFDSTVDIGAVEFQTEAPSLVVTTAEDVVDNADFKTSLREAVALANSQAGPDDISFDATVFATPQTITLTGGVLAITPTGESNATTITGPAAKLTIDGNKISATNFSRVFSIATNSVVSISDMTIANGKAPTGEGGGNILSAGFLTLDRVTVSGGVAFRGAGIHSTGGSIDIVNSTVMSNITGGDSGGGLLAERVAVVRNSTFVGNSTGNSGGGIQFQGTSLTVQNSTIVGNTASGGGGIANTSGVATTFEVSNSIVAGNTRTSASGPGIDLSGAFLVNYSLIGAVNGALLLFGGSGNNITGTDAAPVDAMLSPLAANGGPTDTFALSTSSPAFNAGDPLFTALDFDQRGDGFPRIVGTAVDMGAFEVQDLRPVVSVIANDAEGEETFREPLSFQFTRSGDTTEGFQIVVQLSGTAGSSDLGALLVEGGSLLPDVMTPGSFFLTFSPGVSTVFVTSQPTDDGAAAEGDETVVFAIAEGTDYLVNAAQGSATATIAANGLLVTNIGSIGEGSLQQAIDNANSFAGPDQITFDQTFFATPRFINFLGTVTITGSGGDATSIRGPNGGVTLSSPSRMFIVNANAQLNLTRVTISNSGTLNKDGVIGNAGVVSLNQVTMRDNQSSNGGGIDNAGTLMATDSTFSGNFTTGNGGAIRNSGGTVTLTNVTLSGNRADGGGGAIFTTGAGTVTLNNVTMTNNRSDADNMIGEGGGGIVADGGTVTINNSIVAGNFRGSTGTTEDNIGFTVAGNFSLFGATPAGTVTGTTNLTTTDAKLGPLANNGGLTQTHALLAGSPAVDAGDPNFTVPPNADQRGELRVFGGRLDIGAVEATAFFRIDDGTDNANGEVNTGAQHSMIRRIVVPLAAPLSVADGFRFKFRMGESGVAVGGLTLSLVRLQGNLNFKVRGVYLVDNEGEASLELSFKRQVSANPLQFRDSLPDGDYRLRVGTATIDFFRLLGDVNGDRTVNEIDEIAFNAAFGNKASDPDYRSYFDSNTNNRIASGDRLRFRRQLGKSLAEMG